MIEILTTSSLSRDIGPAMQYQSINGKSTYPKLNPDVEGKESKKNTSNTTCNWKETETKHRLKKSTKRDEKNKSGRRSRNSGRIRPGSRQMVKIERNANETVEKSNRLRIFFITFVMFMTWVVMNGKISHKKRYRTRFESYLK